ncbi:Laccase [Heracleum sosnowskyi]|uniref:Laccase n=1 Tax=Heracleum sosnowskyi TaxID=360622 RepID=A0AAD8HVR5_9APIA|nr:Laccase [Heracleum sosnowskyi]
MKIFALEFLGFLFLATIFASEALVRHATFVVQETSYTRLCETKKILTVNGQFPGQTLFAETGDTIIVDVQNKGNQNITFHWHGVKQPRNPWTDGPEFITQCPIKPGGRFSQRVILSDEQGTLWWHAHSDWSRATVYGAIVIRPKKGTNYPFPKPDKEVPIILGNWWKSDVEEVLQEFLRTGGNPNVSDSLTINGQPGDLLPCSKQDTFKMIVDYGKTYMLRMINAGMNNIFLFGIANHTFTIVGQDAAYVKPFKSDYISITPGQTLDVLFEANQAPDHYYMASKLYIGVSRNAFDSSTTTAILEYRGNYTASSPPLLPILPNITNATALISFSGRLRSLASAAHPINVPLNVDKKFLFTVSVNFVDCNNTVDCSTANNLRAKASINNITFQSPKIDILEAYYRGINGIYGDDFPTNPPLEFDYTSVNLSDFSNPLRTPRNGTEVSVLPFNTTVELVYQGTNLLGGSEHPMHLHGYSFYVVGSGLGNFNRTEDPKRYNLVDPPLVNTINVPRNGWIATRFRADNPGVWLMHCHFERHITWGMEMTFIVRNGKRSDQKMLSRPSDMPPC